MSVTINNAMRYIAYICPFCFEINRKNINTFEVSSDNPFFILCSSDECNEECGAILNTKDGFKIDFECPICGENHIFRISSSGFLFKNLLTLTCPEANIDIFLIGEKEKVEEAVLEKFINS